MKDTYEKDENGKPLGSVYMRYPRAGIWHMLFDIDFCDNCSMYPFLALGMNQNAFFEVGTGLKFFKNYRYLKKIRKAPYYAAACYPGGYGTVGGIRINESSPISGNYV